MQLFHAAAVRALSLPLQLECSLTFVQLLNYELRLQLRLRNLFACVSGVELFADSC